MSKKTHLDPMSIYENSPLERKAAPGPLSNAAKRVSSQPETAEVKGADSEKQFVTSGKKAARDTNVTHDGRINIITQS